MRILIISFFTDWTTHLGVELEIAQRHIDDGDEVVFLSCDGGIKVCRANPQGIRALCDMCRYRRMRGLPALSKPIKEFKIGDYIGKEETRNAEELSSSVTTADAAKNFIYKGQDLGWGALSSTIQELRDPVCDSKEAAEMLPRLTRTAILSYEAVLSFMEKKGPFEIAYIFNGRFASTRGAFRACKTIPEMKVILHERGSSIKKYALFENDLLHKREVWKERIEQSWESEQNMDLKHAVGSLFYEERRAGASIGWRSFTDRQEAGLLPACWDSAKTNIVIFNSSEDEFAGIGDEWKNHIYPMQCEGVRKIVEDSLKLYPDIRFYLRMHPNLVGIENDDVEKLRSIDSINFLYIAPDSDISSYSLLDAADKIISFGSSVGIEATFWDKPSIMAGHSFYEHLGSVYCPNTHEEVLSLIGQELDALPKEGAIKYGYHLRTFGTEFKYWNASEFFDGHFKNAHLTAPVGLFHKYLIPLERWIPTPLGNIFLMDKLFYNIESKLRWIKRKIRKRRSS